MNETENNTNSLLNELKNLNKTLDKELETSKTASKDAANSAPMPFPPATQFATTSSTPVSGFHSKITEDNITDFIFEKSEELIMQALDTIKSLKPIVQSSGDAKSMAGFAEIIKSTTGAMETLNSINIEKRKAKNAKEMKQMDVDTKMKLNEQKKLAPNIKNNVNILATREEIMKMLASGPIKELDQYDVDPPVENDSEEG